MEVNISELSDKKTIHDYPDDTIFVWSEKGARKGIDPKTGYPIYDFSEHDSEENKER
ncbi:MAG: hypothetical protein K6C13_00380 [Oscillospiraceae bacterium]|nr:hypothetical protein [Oscillospiraceae bacterium]